MKENIGYSDMIISDKYIVLWDELFKSLDALWECSRMDDMQWIEEARRHCEKRKRAEEQLNADIKRKFYGLN